MLTVTFLAPQLSTKMKQKRFKTNLTITTKFKFIFLNKQLR